MMKSVVLALALTSSALGERHKQQIDVKTNSFWPKKFVIPEETAHVHTKGKEMAPMLEEVSKIVNGEDASPYRRQWMVSLQSSSDYHFCGGALIAPNMVLTAAHCVQDGVDHVEIGRHDKTSDDEYDYDGQSASSCADLGWDASSAGSEYVAGTRISTKKKTYNKARATCKDKGARLCTADELHTGEADAGGSGVAGWASSANCEDGKATVVGLNSDFDGKSKFDYPGACRETNKQYQFRCCCDTADSTRYTPAESIAVSEVIYDYCYDDSTLDYDVAILILAEDSAHTPVGFLGQTGTSYDPVKVNDVATVMGWGSLKSGADDDGPALLQTVEVPIWKNGNCEKVYETDITDNMMCAGYAGDIAIDSCQGDSGGPLYIADETADNDYLVGIVSWGYGCGSGWPGVYARISKLADWINAIVDSGGTATQTCDDPYEGMGDWTCTLSYYDADDGCDCGCGMVDPDCTGSSTETIWNCNSGEVCSPEGQCITLDDSSVPTWSSSPAESSSSLNSDGTTTTVVFTWSAASNNPDFYSLSVDDGVFLDDDLIVVDSSVLTASATMTCAEDHTVLFKAWNSYGYASNTYTLTVSSSC
jgi:V8-like Glu-specific endopeptidase